MQSSKQFIYFNLRSSQLKSEERSRGGEADFVRSILGDNPERRSVSGSRFETLSRLEGIRDDKTMPYWMRRNEVQLNSSNSGLFMSQKSERNQEFAENSVLPRC